MYLPRAGVVHGMWIHIDYNYSTIFNDYFATTIQTFFQDDWMKAYDRAFDQSEGAAQAFEKDMQRVILKAQNETTVSVLAKHFVQLCRLLYVSHRRRPVIRWPSLSSLRGPSPSAHGPGSPSRT